MFRVKECVIGYPTFAAPSVFCTVALAVQLSWTIGPSRFEQPALQCTPSRNFGKDSSYIKQVLMFLQLIKAKMVAYRYLTF